jgi:hypothetical protein
MFCKPSAKRPKKVKVRHADQRPVYEDPPNWIELVSDEEDEDGWEFPLLSNWAFELMSPFIVDEEDEDEDDILDIEEIDYDDMDFPLSCKKLSKYFVYPSAQEVIDLTLDSEFIIPESPPRFTSARTTLPESRSSTQRRTTVPSSTSASIPNNRPTTRRSVRNVSHPPPITEQVKVVCSSKTL